MTTPPTRPRGVPVYSLAPKPYTTTLPHRYAENSASAEDECIVVYSFSTYYTCAHAHTRVRARALGRKTIHNYTHYTQTA
jgi:hypothetical protein